MVEHDTADADLAHVVREQMEGAATASVEIVTAMSALLARVAFADRRFEPGEADRVREELAQVLGFGQDEVTAVFAVLAANVASVGQGELDRYTDVLREQFDRHMRADVVKVLIELAAADQEIARAEVEVIRSVAAKLLVDEALVEALLLRATGARAGG